MVPWLPFMDSNLERISETEKSATDAAGEAPETRRRL
jgi:hypothetical protein